MRMGSHGENGRRFEGGCVGVEDARNCTSYCGYYWFMITVARTSRNLVRFYCQWDIFVHLSEATTHLAQI